MVSVILPTFNRAGFLRDCVASVLQQTGVELELVVVDDGSDDNTREVLSSFNDKRLKVHAIPHSGMIGKVRNYGIEQASGEFIAFIDSDDTWAPDKLSRQLNLLEENPELGFSLTDLTVYQRDSILKEFTYRHRSMIQCANIFNWITDEGFLIYPQAMIIRRSCLEVVGNFDESRHAGCLSFNMRLAYHFKCGVIFEPLVIRRLHDSNHSEEYRYENYEEYLHTYQQLYAQRMITKGALVRARANAFFKIGQLQAIDGKFGEARKSFLRSLANDPFRQGSYRGLLKSLVRVN